MTAMRLAEDGTFQCYFSPTLEPIDFATALDRGYFHDNNAIIASEDVVGPGGLVRVVTRFTPIDHCLAVGGGCGCPDGPWLWFTLLENIRLRRYTSEGAALAGHREVVAQAQLGVVDIREWA